VGFDPVEEEVAGLAAGFAEEDGAGGLEVAAPEGFEEGPLDALVEDVGADDDVELLGEAGLLPVEAAGADAVGEGGELRRAKSSASGSRSPKRTWAPRPAATVPVRPMPQPRSRTLSWLTSSKRCGSVSARKSTMAGELSQSSAQ